MAGKFPALNITSFGQNLFQSTFPQHKLYIVSSKGDITTASRLEPRVATPIPSCRGHLSPIGERKLVSTGDLAHISQRFPRLCEDILHLDMQPHHISNKCPNSLTHWREDGKNAPLLSRLSSNKGLYRADAGSNRSQSRI
jgi:hypothetical protein